MTKIDPGKGYRILDKNEILNHGDEYLAKGVNQWYKTNYAGKRVESIGFDGVYRRKVKASPMNSKFIEKAQDLAFSTILVTSRLHNAALVSVNLLSKEEFIRLAGQAFDSTKKLMEDTTNEYIDKWTHKGDNPNP